MRCRLGVSEGSVGKGQGLVDSPEHPQCDGIVDLRYDTRILAEPVGEIGVPRRVVELDGPLKMVMGAGKIAEIKAGRAGNAVCDQGLGTMRPGRGFAQQKLGHFADGCRFAAHKMPDPETVISGETLHRVFHPACQFAGARKGGTRFRRLMSFGPEQRIAKARL
jgi:hypothetical protein